MRTIGLTGGIASGKTLAANYLRQLGATIIDTDVIAREIVMSGSPVLAAIRDTFGEGVMDSRGCLDRAALRRLIFDDEANRRRLNALTHPVIEERVRERLATASGDVAVLVVPLLVGSHLQTLCDEIWLLQATPSQQIERVMVRDNLTRKEAAAILAGQPTLAEYRAIADRVIDNSGSSEETKHQIEEAFQAFIKDE